MNYDKDYEIKIADNVANICNFKRTVSGLSYTCNKCGKQMYEPRPNPLINERMIRHFQTHKEKGDV